MACFRCFHPICSPRCLGPFQGATGCSNKHYVFVNSLACLQKVSPARGSLALSLPPSLFCARSLSQPESSLQALGLMQQDGMQDQAHRQGRHTGEAGR